MKLSKALKSLSLKSTVIGPFKPDQYPVRSGVYLRVSPKTGGGVFAYYDYTRSKWGLYAETPARALALKNKHSTKPLAWYASASSSSAQPLTR